MTSRKAPLDLRIQFRTSSTIVEQARDLLQNQHPGEGDNLVARRVFEFGALILTGNAKDPRGLSAEGLSGRLDGLQSAINALAEQQQLSAQVNAQTLEALLAGTHKLLTVSAALVLNSAESGEKLEQAKQYLQRMGMLPSKESAA